ncbi:ABC-2 transporter permease [Lysinibacillus sp. NPDC056959]|uniref:ABC-2 transporter permease n=1 Tax=Lysinibacillus sp. NPDC056959 TaxID=3345981 RepID=UPI00362F565D
MFNLIFKDILIQKKLILFYIATIILYLVADISSLILIGFVYSVVFIMSAFSYDEKDNANILLNSLPYTRKEIVSSKYIGSLIFATIFIFIVYVGNFLLNGKEVLFIWKEMLLIFGLVMIAISFLLPIAYKFKSQFFMIASGALFGIYMLIINTFIPDFNNKLRALIQKFMTLQETQMYLIAIFTIVILYIGSWLLSIRIYERKAF